MILSIQDFTGKYQVSTGMYDQAKLQDYINRYEPRYLKELFGITFYNEFKSDLLNNVPQSPNFLVLFNPLSEDIGYNFYYFNGIYEGVNQLDSEGIKEMLKGFIYFEYVKDLSNQITPIGLVKPDNENSTVANTLFSMMYTRYNEAIRSYNSIRDFIRYTTAPPLGQAVTLNLTSGGTGYVNQTNVSLTGGTGTGLKVDIIEDGSGVVDEVTITQTGTGYTIGDTFTLPGGNNDATIELTYVGIGDYRKFRGVPKLTAYWL
jgi:hypothetical protein